MSSTEGMMGGGEEEKKMLSLQGTGKWDRKGGVKQDLQGVVKQEKYQTNVTFDVSLIYDKGKSVRHGGHQTRGGN